jgi:predicted Zn-dependent protease
MRRLLILMCTMGFILNMVAQNNIEPCAQNRIIELLEQQYPGFIKQYDHDYLQMIHPKKVDSRKVHVFDTVYYQDTIYTIPVVFHVLWNTAAENIKDSLLINQIEVLNQDFRRVNADTANTRSIFKSRASDSRIQFVLADKDPNGAATNGIDRKYTTRTSFYTQNLTEMKSASTNGADAWDPTRYLNIWVCDLSYAGQDALLGFAYPPNGHPFWSAQTWIADQNQGVVLHYKITGRNNPLSNMGVLLTSKMGRVAVHEVGHYFGLRHIWGDGNGNGCAVDDFIFDTPNQAVKSNFDCNVGVNTCTDPGAKQYPDMIENYMDYSAHSCQNMFTKEQVNAMRNCIVDYRFTLPSKMEIIQKKRAIDSFNFDRYKVYVSQNQTITIEIPNGKTKQNILADLYDMSGNKVFGNIALISNETIVSTTLLAPGIYIVNVKDAAQNVLLKEKIFIQKN